MTNFQINEISIKKSSIEIDNNFLIKEKNNMKLEIKLKDLQFIQTGDNNYLSTMGIQLKGLINQTEEVFQLEVEYYATSTISGFSQEDIFKIQNINMANVLYPYIRSECNRLMSDTNLPKFQLQLIDFAAIYMNKYEKGGN